MQSTFRFLIPFLLLFLISVEPVFSQAHIRPEDHFFRKRVVNRIDLNEKINQPLIQRSAISYGNARQTSMEGLISALLKGLENGTYVAYHPDEINRVLSYEEVIERMQLFEEALMGLEGDGWEEEIAPDEGFWEEVDVDGNVVVHSASNSLVPAMDLGPYEQVIQFAEDRIFDKNRSQMVYRLDHFQIIWQDPGEVLPEKVLAIFKYPDVASTLDQVSCTNRFNDAERRTLKEVFELRMFNSYIINIGDHGVQSLPEAELQRQQLVKLEHEYWNY